MISTEEKIEIMQRERIAYKEGYRAGLREATILVVAGLICAIIVIIIT